MNLVCEQTISNFADARACLNISQKAFEAQHAKLKVRLAPPFMAYYNEEVPGTSRGTDVLTKLRDTERKFDALADVVVSLHKPAQEADVATLHAAMQKAKSAGVTFHAKVHEVPVLRAFKAAADLEAWGECRELLQHQAPEGAGPLREIGVSHLPTGDASTLQQQVLIKAAADLCLVECQEPQQYARSAGALRTFFQQMSMVAFISKDFGAEVGKISHFLSTSADDTEEELMKKEEYDEQY